MSETNKTPKQTSNEAFKAVANEAPRPQIQSGAHAAALQYSLPG